MKKDYSEQDQDQGPSQEYKDKYSRKVNSPVLRSRMNDTGRIHASAGYSGRNSGGPRRTGKQSPNRKKPDSGDRHIKPFSAKQTPIAIISVVLVVVIVALVLVLGKSNVKVTSGSSSKKTAAAGKNTTTETTTLPSNTAAYNIESSIIVQGDRAMEIYYVNQETLENYGKEINTFAGRVSGSEVYVLLAPTSLEFYGPNDYRTDSHSFTKSMKYVYSQLTASNVKSVNARDVLAGHVNEYIYFRTDHHWTATGAYYAYTAFCKASGQKATALKSHKTGKIDNFVGSLYRYTNAQVLKDNPDYVQYYYPLHEAKGMIYSNSAMTNGTECQVINTTASGENAYLCFIEGDNPIEKFTTNVNNGKSIVLIKESFGDAFAPWIIDNYSTVYVIDPRKVDLDLADFVNTNKINDVLFLNYGFAPSNPTYKAALSKMLA